MKEEISRALWEYGVPRGLLLTMGYVNTPWEMPPASDHPERRGNYGVMALTRNPPGDALGKAASLTSLSVEAPRSDCASNVRGGVAVPAGTHEPSDLGGLYDAVSNYGGGALYEVLQGGASATIVTGEGAGFCYRAMPERRERQRA